MTSQALPVSPAPLPAPSQADALVSELLRSKGNLAVASERLGLSLTDVIKLLNDPSAAEKLSLAIRSQVVIQAFNAIDELSIVLPTLLADMEPNEAFKAFSTLIAAVAQLTAPVKNTASISLNQQNNYFTAEDAEVARGKVLDFVRRIDDSAAIETTATDASDEHSA